MLPDVYNYHISPTVLQSIKAINQFHFLVMCAHYIFYNFSHVIFHCVPKRFFSYCIFALQIDFIFPMCVRVLSKIKISPSNICLYIIAARLKTGVTARIGYMHILPMVDVNSAQIGTGGMT